MSDFVTFGVTDGVCVPVDDPLCVPMAFSLRMAVLNCHDVLSQYHFAVHFEFLLCFV